MANPAARPASHQRALFILYLIFFAAVASAIALVQPILDNPPLFSNPPDEHSRILIPEFIARNGFLPTGLEDELKIEGYGVTYGLTPYLPYILMGYLMRVVLLFTDSGLALVYTGRFVNVACGVVMAAVVYFMGKRLFADSRFKWLFCISVMYFPEMLFMHTYINTESMCYLGIALILYGLVCIYQDAPNYRNCILFSIGIIFVTLTYYNAYGYLVSALALFIAYFVSRTKNGKPTLLYKPMLRFGLFVLALVMLGAAWWFIRSAILHNGDFLGMTTQNEMFLAANPEGRPSYMNKGYSLSEMFAMNPDYFEKLLKTLIAGFGSAAMFCNDWFYKIYELYFACGIFLSAVFGVSGTVSAKRRKEAVSFRRYFFHINMIYCILMPMVLHLYYVYSTDYQPQGRYLLPFMIPLVYYVVSGYDKLTAQKGNAWCTKVRGVLPYFAGAFVILTLVWMVFKVSLPVYLSDPVWNQF